MPSVIKYIYRKISDNNINVIGSFFRSLIDNCNVQLFCKVNKACKSDNNYVKLDCYKRNRHGTCERTRQHLGQRIAIALN